MKMSAFLRSGCRDDLAQIKYFIKNCVGTLDEFREVPHNLISVLLTNKTI